MHDKKNLALILSFILLVAFGTANTVIADENSSGILSGLTGKIFGIDENWKKEKEIQYAEQFKGELYIGDQIERIDFSKNYVEIFNAELDDMPSVIFIARTKSGIALMDIVYDERDMYKFYRYQKMENLEKRNFLQESFAKYDVDLTDPDHKIQDKEDYKLKAPPAPIVTPAEPLPPRTVAPSSKENLIRERLRILNGLREDGLITQREFDPIRKRILSEL
jgi:predicted RNA-binding protein